MPDRSPRPVHRLRPVGSLLPAAWLLAVGLLVTGCAGPAGSADAPGRADASAQVDNAGPAASGGPSQLVMAPRALEPEEIPGLGAATRAAIPSKTSQAVVVTGADRDSDRSAVRVYERDPDTGWQPASDEWPAHNAVRGWTDDHRVGDLRSPIGVFGLTDAGGRLADPGTKLPYDRGPAFTATGNGAQGEPLAGSFDYVVAINYNRKPGTTPLDWTRPLGAEKGGGIWLHVDHGGATQGCVSLPRERMRELLRLLDPAKRPVVVMGDWNALGR
ncbi:L,D-transpeptidase family protein [Streptomyces sp. NRRL F-5135]|uniref:L,D-transpeptidase family protein n=1 Tax=Streptomyces sp. NRRL F-5135 TaxID=1463858 RepID=UPI000691B2E9|nr:L,D-transpeptidase family protein [Streptomyces sp. NRRL F-5135]